MEALGGANAAVPFMSSIILGAEAIRLAGSEAQKAAWLPKLASGDAKATFAFAEGPGQAFATGVMSGGGPLRSSKLPADDGGHVDIQDMLRVSRGSVTIAINRLGGRRRRADAWVKVGTVEVSMGGGL